MSRKTVRFGAFEFTLDNNDPYVIGMTLKMGDREMTTFGTPDEAEALKNALEEVDSGASVS